VFVTPDGRFTVGAEVVPNPAPLIVSCTLLLPTRTVSGSMLLITGVTLAPPVGVRWRAGQFSWALLLARLALQYEVVEPTETPVCSYDGCGVGDPRVVERGADVVDLGFAGVVGIHSVVLKSVDDDQNGVVPKIGDAPAAASGATVGDMTIGFVVDDFALEERSDTVIAEVAHGIGAGVEVGGQSMAILVRNAFAN